VVAAGDEIVPDAAARLPGRGAYLHPSLECLERAQRRRAFSRALRLPAALPDGKLAEHLAAEVKRQKEEAEICDERPMSMRR
jgi:predicted RNA-binding protein YlxR (DUF448 family)